MAGASSLAALALAAAPLSGEGSLLVPLLDARKQEVYAGFYRARGGVEEAFPERALSPKALAELLDRLRSEGEQALVFGEGLAACGDALEGLPRLAAPVATAPALAVAQLCAAALEGASYDAARLYALEPHYVRASEAEIRFPAGLPASPAKPR